MTNSYPTDLSDEQWAVLEPLVPPAKHGGRHRTVDIRKILDTIFYQLRTGCQWGMLPNDLSPKSTAHGYLRRWKKDGTWQRMLDTLREKTRIAQGREHPTPSVCVIDSQSVKTTEIGGVRGCDGAKKINGRKRHILVDTLGLLVGVTVTAASVDDAAAAQTLLSRSDPACLARLEKILADRKYHNHDLYAWIKKHMKGCRLEIASRPPGSKGFVLLPKRWVVERSFAWLGRYRRHSKDYERYVETSEAMIKATFIHRMLNRLRPKASAPVFSYR